MAAFGSRMEIFMYNLKIGETLHGFRVTEKKELGDIFAVMYLLEYTKNGARLLLLDRPDENKTFSVAFKTVPSDSTGVFHIIEHSVLCGSEKFPVKEPFVELLKGSLQTFLNAMTFPDKTVYPISTRNDKDFQNLTEVYLDAVFRPLMRRNKSVFLQEGWRREIDEDGRLSYNGVVFNEMKGAYSSPDELSETLATEMLYGTSPYAHDSGGNPEHIRDLSYEEFLNAHAVNYHPSNAYFFLDGEVELDKTLALIESYISGYERIAPAAELPRDISVGKREKFSQYEISEGESTENKARLTLGYLSTAFDEVLETTALDIVLEAVSTGNDSPVQKAFIKSGLCEKTDVATSTGKARNNIFAEFQNLKDGKADEAEKLFLSVIRKEAEQGVDRGALEAALNRLEFAARENNTGAFPIGVGYAIGVLETWLYGGDPAAPFRYTENFGKLRELLKTDYYEKLLKKYILENENSVRLILIPSVSLGKERAEREAELCESEAKRLTEEDISILKEEAAALDMWQSSEDTPEALASIPSLLISDISEEIEEFPTEAGELSGCEVIRHDAALGGIYYVDLFFDASDVNVLSDITFLSSMLSSSGTSELDGFDFANLKKRELGKLTASFSCFTKNKDTRLFLKVSASMLEEKKPRFLEILKSFLFDTTLTDKSIFKNIVLSNKIGFENGMVSAGDSVGFVRCAAYENGRYAATEKLCGYDFYTRVRELAKNFDESADSVLQGLRSLRERLFVKDRVTLAFSGVRDEAFEKSVLELLPRGTAAAAPLALKPLGKLGEGFAIPAQVGFAVSCATLPELDGNPVGALNVAKLLLNFEYLWSEVRVKGGAYGVGMRISREGVVGCTSYRDPSPEASLSVFERAADFLAAFAEEDRDLTKYIIGAIGSFEPYYSKPYRASVATSNYLSGYSSDTERRLKREILSCDKNALLAAAEILRCYAKKANRLIVAPADKLGACENIISV